MGCNDSGVIRVSYKGVVQFDDYVTLEEARNRLVPDGVHITAEHIAGNISRVICEQIRGMDWFDWASLHPSYGSYETKMYNYPVFSPTGTTLENGDKRQGINWEMDFRLAHKQIRRAEVVAENRKSITNLENVNSTIREDLFREGKIEEILKAKIAKIEETLKSKIEKNLETIRLPRRKSILVSASNRSIPRRASRENTTRRRLASIPPRTPSPRRDSPGLLRL